MIACQVARSEYPLDVKGSRRCSSCYGFVRRARVAAISRAADSGAERGEVCGITVDLQIQISGQAGHINRGKHA